MVNRRHHFRLYFATAVLLLVIGVPSTADSQAVQRWDALLQSALDAARQDKQPLGIIISRNQLCAVASPAVTLASKQSNRDFLTTIANLSGGSATLREGVLEVVIGTPPERLIHALNHSFSSFPTVDGTAPYFGALLSGWLKSTLPGNTGFALDVASSSEEPVLHIDQTSNVSVRQVANKVVRLRSGGIWLALDSSDGKSDPETSMLLVIEGFDGAKINKVSRLNLRAYC